MCNHIAARRRAAFLQQRGCCHYCGHLMWEADIDSFARASGLTLAQAKHHQSTAEHVVARIDKGTDAQSNIVAACLVCNQRRHRGRAGHAPSADDFRRRVRMRCARGAWLPWLEPGAHRVDSTMQCRRLQRGRGTPGG